MRNAWLVQCCWCFSCSCCNEQSFWKTFLVYWSERNLISVGSSVGFPQSIHLTNYVRDLREPHFGSVRFNWRSRKGLSWLRWSKQDQDLDYQNQKWYYSRLSIFINFAYACFPLLEMWNVGRSEVHQVKREVSKLKVSKSFFFVWHFSTGIQTYPLQLQIRVD